jgi:hypothetical protein
MPVAVGTALVVISMNSFAGLAGHLSSAHIDWRLAGAVTAAALVGTLVGARLTALVNPAALRKAFGWFVLVMASVILAEEVHPVLGVAAAGVTVVAAGITFACTRYAHCPLRRITSRHTVAVATG